MRCVPLFIFLFNAAYAIPEEIEGSERGTVLSVRTAAGVNGEGDRKLTCAAISGCITLNTDCSCASCNNLSNCVAYDPNTCLCTGCSTLYKVNTKGKCVCVPVTGSVLDKKCAVIGCSSGYTYLSTVKKCCKNVDNCGTYDSSTCACTGCVSSMYSLKNGKCVCKTIKGCSQYDTNCNCTGCSSTYVFSAGKCVTQSPTPAPTAPTPAPTAPTPAPTTPPPVRSCPAANPCYCTAADQCLGVQSAGVYDCSGTYTCDTQPCKHACGGATFAGSSVACHDHGCEGATFTDSVVNCGFFFGCYLSTITNSVTTCTSGGSCSTINVSGGTNYCNDAFTCDHGTYSNSVVYCPVDLSCYGCKFDNNSIVTCSTTRACEGSTFSGGACCVAGGYCPTTGGGVQICPTPAPTPVPTPAPTMPTVMCPSGQYVTGLRIEFGAAINQIFGLLCSGSTSYLATDGMGAHVHDTDLTESPINSGGYCQYSVGLLLYTPINTVSSGLTLKDCTVNNVSQGPYGSPSKDVKQFTCPTGKKYVGISGTSESWTDSFSVYYPALLSQFSMICG